MKGAAEKGHGAAELTSRRDHRDHAARGTPDLLRVLLSRGGGCSSARIPGKGRGRRGDRAWGQPRARFCPWGRRSRAVRGDGGGRGGAAAVTARTGGASPRATSPKC